jgi:signal peptidase I
MTLYSDSRHEAEQAALGPRKRSADKPPKKDRPSNGASGLPEWARELWEWVRTFIIALAVVLLLHAFVFNLSTVEGHSMEPTLQDKEWLFVNKFCYRFGLPQRGDVVILRDPTEGPDKKDYLVKRVVGVPGDRIEIRDGELYRNGEHVVEPYTDTRIEDLDYGPLQVGAGQYFVMGDNRHAHASKDSRVFGTVPLDVIKGRADYILWPIADMHSL